MISQEERVSRLEGIIEQINERLGSIESRLGLIERNTSMIMDLKADKTEVRLVLVTMVALFSVVFGLFGVMMSNM